MECSLDFCDRKAQRRGFCRPHYNDYLGNYCYVDDCKNPAIALKLCSMHRQREKAGLPMDYVKKTGRTYLSREGYVVEYMPGHQQADEDGKVLQHRRVMSDSLNRRLHPYENVHHKNGVRGDNRMENLELWVKQQPAGQRVEDLREYAKWILSEYPDE